MRNCIATENLQPGMVIIQVTKQNGPLKIRKTGLVTSVEMIQGLLEMGIQEVQIDPSQTVEIETSASVIQSSATMQLLQSNNSTQVKADHQLHDQFNRSLFLPSVQDIPSQWQFYTKRAATLTTLVVAGLVLGFGAAYLPSVLALRSPIVVAAPAESVADKTALIPTSTPETAKTVVATTEPSPPPVLKPDVTEQAQIKATGQVNKPVVEQATELSNTLDNPSPDKLEVQPKETGKVIQQIQPEKSEPLSPELVKRFEKVMRQMDREDRYGVKNGGAEQTQQNTDNTGPIVDLSEFPILDEQGEALPEQTLSELKVSEHKNSGQETSEQGELLAKQKALTQVAKERTVQDVPRIDQLPDWLMGELPSMSFSAHMYASVPSERWVRVNGQNKHEGDLIDNKVQIVQIAPQHVILNYAGHEFSMQAMTDW